MCVACQSRTKSKIGMKQKTDFKTAGTIAAGVVAAGTVAAMIQTKLFPVKAGAEPNILQRPLGSGLIQIGLGMLTPGLIKGATGKNLATGMIVSGIATSVLTVIGRPGAAGLLRSTGSTYLPGVSGYSKNSATKTAENKVTVGMN